MLHKSGATISIHGLVGAKSNYWIFIDDNVLVIEEIDEQDGDKNDAVWASKKLFPQEEEKKSNQ